MKNRIGNIISLIAFLLFFYIFLNIEILLWSIINPIGFWGIFWFISVSGAISVVIITLLQTVIALLLIKKSGNITAIAILGIFVFTLISIVFTVGPNLVITKAFYDRYRYVEKTERYLNEGKYNKALKFSEKIYQKVPSSEKSNSSIWVLKKIFQNSKKGKKTLVLRRYQASVCYAFCLQSLGNKLNEAEELYLNCEDISKIHFINEPDYYVLPIVGRSLIYIYKGEPIKVEKCYNQLSSFFYHLEPKDLEYTVNMILIYSMFIERHGDFNKARELRKEALELYKQSEESKESHLYLTLLLSVISDYFVENQIKEAQSLVIESEKIAQRRRKQLIYLDYLQVKARYAEYNGHLKDAENLYLKALRKSRKKGRSEYITKLTSTASFYFRQSDFQKAKYYHELSLRKSFGNFKSFVSVGQSQILGLSLSNFALGEYNLSLSGMNLLDSLLKDQINQNFEMLITDEKELFVLKVGESFRLSNSMYLALKDTSLYGNIFDNVIALKSIALQSNQYMNDLLSSIGRQKLKDRYNNILAKKKELESLLIAQSKNEPRLKKLSDSIYFSERHFIEEINQFREFQPFDITTMKWKDIRNSLHENEVAIEFINCPANPCLTGNNKYYALILMPNIDSPKLVSLFDEEDLQDLLEFKGDIFDGINRLYSDSSFIKLYNCIWKPIKPFIDQSDKIYISLSGILHKISFPALTINEANVIHILSSTRLLTSRDYSDELRTKNAVLFGDINYNLPEDGTSNPSNNSNRNINFSIYRSLKLNRFQALPGTGIEINEINKILNQHQFHVFTYTGHGATEKSFREITSYLPTIIHVATHGFYFPEERSIMASDIVFDNTNYNMTIENPMFRSGLLFAGANSINKTSFLNDGVLTANEIAGLDLTDVEIVVLSACETGLGDIRGSEGVFGLQRAFKLAGANSLVMSLWKIPDKQTSELMKLFYQNYLSGLSAQEALTKAQDTIRKKYPAPFYWAAFFVID